jgi:drug/metabolite transporter (DMT)-like permease
MRKLTEVQRGALWMVGASAALATSDALAKSLVFTYSSVEILWVRYVVQMIFLCMLFAGRLRTLISSRRIAMQIARGLILVVQNAVFYIGLRFVPLADATAILFVAPMFVVTLSVPVLCERVRWPHWLAVVAGFAGATVIIQPGMDSFQMAALLPLATAVLYAVYQIMTRILGRTDSPRSTLFYTVLAGMMATTVLAPFSWVPPAYGDWPSLIATGLLSGLGHFFLIKAFSAAPAATISPLSYFSLIWAAIFGLAFFDELPDLRMLLGSILIVSGGLYLFRSTGEGHRAEALRKD